MIEPGIKKQWLKALNRAGMNGLRIAACAELLLLQIQLVEKQADLHSELQADLATMLNGLQSLKDAGYELASHEVNAQRDAGLVTRDEWLRELVAQASRGQEQAVQLVQALKL